MDAKDTGSNESNEIEIALTKDEGDYEDEIRDLNRQGDVKEPGPVYLTLMHCVTSFFLYLLIMTHNVAILHNLSTGSSANATSLTLTFLKNVACTCILPLADSIPHVFKKKKTRATVSLTLNLIAITLLSAAFVGGILSAFLSGTGPITEVSSFVLHQLTFLMMITSLVTITRSSIKTANKEHHWIWIFGEEYQGLENQTTYVCKIILFIGSAMFFCMDYNGHYGENWSIPT